MSDHPGLDCLSGRSQQPRGLRCWPRNVAHRCGASIVVFNAAVPRHRSPDAADAGGRTSASSNSRGRLACATNRAHLTGSLYLAKGVSDVHLVADGLSSPPRPGLALPSDLRDIVQRPTIYLPPSISPCPLVRLWRCCRRDHESGLEANLTQALSRCAHAHASRVPLQGLEPGHSRPTAATRA